MRALLLMIALLLPAAARAGAITDATGRNVQVPETVARVLPAGAPAAVLLAVLAPDLMLGWPMPLPDDARAMLDPVAAALPQVPHLAGHGEALAAVVALRPDLIVDYGTVSPDYIAQAQETQARTGIATLLLDGRLSETPGVLRALGAVLHREARAESLARLAEAMLTPPPPPEHPPRVVYLRGTGPLKAAAAGTGATEVFARLGWQVLAPPGPGWFRAVTREDVASLDPDILIFADPAMRATVAGSADWRGLRAVREGHAYTAPRLPFGWIEEPPSVNQWLGAAWLAGGDAATLAGLFNAVAYGRVLPPDALRAMAQSALPLPP